MHYLNDGQAFTLLNAGTFYWNQPRILASDARLLDTTIDGSGIIRLEASDPSAWRLIVPAEVDIGAEQTTDTARAWSVRGRNDGFLNNYTIYAIRTEVQSDGVQATALVSAR